MTDVVMPRLSDTMEEGTILRWLIGDGEPVRRGEELVEIETDKANMTYEADVEGVLEIVCGEGETLPVGAVIARVGEAAAGGQADSFAAGHARARSDGDGDVTVPPVEGHARARGDGENDTSIPSGAGHARARTGWPAASTAQAQAGETERVKASPVARRIATERGVDLHELAGSGPGGRIVKADVEGAAGGAVGASREQGVGQEAPRAGGLAGTAHGEPAAPKPGGLADVATAKGETTEVELTKTQQTIARRMAESKATIPDFALQTDIDMSACAELRAELKRLLPGGGASASTPPASSAREAESGEVVPTYNDMVVKAAALALREHPGANSSYRDGRLQLHGRVNVGVAVAVEPGGAGGGALVVPTVFDADTKSLGEIARETRALAAKVRDGTITPPELGGGTFTVSNLGMFGVDAFTAIVNPPQAAILAVGAVKPRPVVGEDGEITARETMTVTLACDHRILYGADAARFLARIKGLLEQPASLTL